MSQTSRPINNDSDSDDDSPLTRPQRRVPAFHSSSQEDSSLVVKGNQQYLNTMFLLCDVKRLTLQPGLKELNSSGHPLS